MDSCETRKAGPGSGRAGPQWPHPWAARAAVACFWSPCRGANGSHFARRGSRGLQGRRRIEGGPTSGPRESANRKSIDFLMMLPQPRDATDASVKCRSSLLSAPSTLARHGVVTLAAGHADAPMLPDVRPISPATAALTSHWLRPIGTPWLRAWPATALLAVPAVHPATTRALGFQEVHGIKVPPRSTRVDTYIQKRLQATSLGPGGKKIRGRG